MVAALALLGMVCAGAACTSSHAATSTPKPTALAIPPPFEIHEQVAFGSVTILVDSFRRTGDSVTVDVTVENETADALPVAGEPTFSIFYATGLHRPGHIAGLTGPIAPNGSTQEALDFTVPAAYQYPLLWFTSKEPGIGPDTIVLRGTHG